MDTRLTGLVRDEKSTTDEGDDVLVMLIRPVNVLAPANVKAPVVLTIFNPPVPDIGALIVLAVVLL